MSTSVEEKVAMTKPWWAPITEHLSGVETRHVVDSDEIKPLNAICTISTWMSKQQHAAWNVI
jgi:hypothetical protein